MVIHLLLMKNDMKQLVAEYPGHTKTMLLLRWKRGQAWEDLMSVVLSGCDLQCQAAAFSPHTYFERAQNKRS